LRFLAFDATKEDVRTKFRKISNALLKASVQHRLEAGNSRL